MAVLRRVCDDRRAAPRGQSRGPDWLEAIIDRLLAKDPARRFQSAAEVAVAWGLAWPTSSSLSPFPCRPAWPRNRPRSGTWRRHLIRGILAASILAAVAAGARSLGSSAAPTRRAVRPAARSLAIRGHRGKSASPVNRRELAATRSRRDCARRGTGPEHSRPACIVPRPAPRAILSRRSLSTWHGKHRLWKARSRLTARWTGRTRQSVRPLILFQGDEA